MASFENKVARLRKIDEMTIELSDIVKCLKAEATQLRDEVFTECSRKPSLYNVVKHKTCALGFAGKNLFRVDFGKELTRIGGERLDNQEWLGSLMTRVAKTHPGWVKAKLELNSAMIKSEIASGVLTLDELAVEHGLQYDTSYKVKVTKLPSDAEIEAIKAAALNEVDCM